MKVEILGLTLKEDKQIRQAGKTNQEGQGREADNGRTRKDIRFYNMGQK
jgi:hypothetical protein